MGNSELLAKEAAGTQELHENNVTAESLSKDVAETGESSEMASETDDTVEDVELAEELDDGESSAQQIAETRESSLELASRSDSQVQALALLGGLMIRASLKIAIVGMKAGMRAFFKKVNKGSVKRFFKGLGGKAVSEATGETQYVEKAGEIYQLVRQRTVMGCVTSRSMHHYSYKNDMLWCIAESTKSGCEFYTNCKWVDLTADAPEARDIAEGAVYCYTNKKAKGKCGR